MRSKSLSNSNSRKRIDFGTGAFSIARRRASVSRIQATMLGVHLSEGRLGDTPPFHESRVLICVGSRPTVTRNKCVG